MTHVTQEKWSSGMAFLLAAIGSAVGLGNIYRFPYIVGQNGGGAFVLLYLGVVLFFGIPLIMTELTIGRRSAERLVQFFPDVGRVTAVPDGQIWLPLQGCWTDLLPAKGPVVFFGGE